MKEMSQNWSEQQLKAYLLIYCAQADFVETAEERAYITSKVNADTLAEMRIEFDKDNDYDHIQKVLQALDNLGYNDLQRAKLVDEMKGLFMSDGKFDRVEKNLFRELKRLL